MTSQEMKDALNRYETARHNASCVEDDGEDFKKAWLEFKKAETEVFEVLCAMFTDPDEAEELASIKTVFSDPMAHKEFIREMIWDARK